MVVISLTEPERLFIVKLVRDARSSLNTSTSTTALYTRTGLDELIGKLGGEEKEKNAKSA